MAHSRATEVKVYKDHPIGSYTVVSKLSGVVFNGFSELIAAI
jgi:hypothetical protein